MVPSRLPGVHPTWLIPPPCSSSLSFHDGGSQTLLRTKVSVQISRGIESLFGTRDENIRLLETGLRVRTQLLEDSLEIEGEEADVARAESILNDYVSLVREGHSFGNGDLNSFLRVVTEDPDVTLRDLVEEVGAEHPRGPRPVAPPARVRRTSRWPWPSRRCWRNA